MNLVLVESPTKSKTLKKFLGKDFRVEATFGHVRDLPQRKLGIDTEHDFKPTYVIIPKAKKNIKILKELKSKAKEIIIASDPDREGEAIAYHLVEILGLSKKPYKRIAFHEITKSAIDEALKNPRKIDMLLVEAQQARRILDRLVGYKLSPFLWRKIMKGLSAGRVQSVAVRLVVEREEEIKKFIPKEYHTIEALLSKLNGGKEFTAILFKKDENIIDKFFLKTKEEADKIVDSLKGAEFKVKNIERKETKKNPLPPLTTSTLQQEAWNKYKFQAKYTMRMAQNLYEQGLITYHRTDSLNLSEQSLNQAKNYITREFGAKYHAGYFRKFKAKGNVQEAHEAIRPVDPSIKIAEGLSPQETKLYTLIWQRFISSQMKEAEFDSIQIDIEAKNCIFRANGQTLKFDGFLKVYPMKFEETDLPSMKANELLKLLKLSSFQHFTQAPKRYSEASLIKALEENGIGRPSTYAPILATIQDRNYVEKNEEKRFIPTEMGLLVNNLLVKHFPEVVDINFTAKMEEDLDKVAQNELSSVNLLKEFYVPFEKNLKEKEKEVEKHEFVEEKTNEICEKCKSPMVIKRGRYGKFIACSNFPECKNVKNIEKKLGIKCPRCKIGELIEKKSKRGKVFYACNRYPQCDFALWDKPINELCPKCGQILIETKKKEIKCSNKECNFAKKEIDLKPKN